MGTYALISLVAGCVADPNLDQSPGAADVEKPVAAPPARIEQKAPPVQEEAAPKIAALPPRLLGMSRAEIIKHLGQPAFQRRDQTALLLRYREGRCILDLFLYPRGPSEPLKSVDYIEARAADGKRLETRPCIDAVRKAYIAG